MLVSLVVVAGAVTVWWTRFYERWMVWAAKPSSSGENGEQENREGPRTRIAATMLAVFVMIEVFSATTSLAVQANIIPMTGQFAKPMLGQARPAAASTVLLPGAPDLYEANERYLAWTLLDAVPVLKVPETLELRQPGSHPTGWRGGGFVLTFKLLVLLPFVTFAKSLYSKG